MIALTWALQNGKWLGTIAPTKQTYSIVEAANYPDRFDVALFYNGERIFMAETKCLCTAKKAANDALEMAIALRPL